MMKARIIKDIFIIEAPDEETIKKKFGPMKVEVNEVKLFSYKKNFFLFLNIFFNSFIQK
jgi:hypothetical protein